MTAQPIELSAFARLMRAHTVLRRELEAVRTAVDGMRRDLAGSPEAQERLQAQVEQTRTKVNALETALSEERGLADWVDEVKSRMSSLELALAETGAAQSADDADDVRAELADARARLERIESERAEERERVQREVETARERLRSEFREAREQLEGELVGARERAERDLAGTRERLAEIERERAAGGGGEELAGIEARAAEAADTRLAEERTRLEAEIAEQRERVEAEVA